MLQGLLHQPLREREVLLPEAGGTAGGALPLERFEDGEKALVGEEGAARAQEPLALLRVGAARELTAEDGAGAFAQLLLVQVRRPKPEHRRVRAGGARRELLEHVRERREVLALLGLYAQGLELLPLYVS